MTIKRLILAFLTVLALARVFFSLEGSLSEPQIQSRLELYQTDLVLHVSELRNESVSDTLSNGNVSQAVDSLIGEEPYADAQEQYQKARTEALISRTNFQAQLDQISSSIIANSELKNKPIISDLKATDVSYGQKQQLKQKIAEINHFIAELDLKLGILQASDGKTDQAIDTWNDIVARRDEARAQYRQTAAVLSNLWSESPQVFPTAESDIKASLNGWFAYRALQQLYQVEGDRVALDLLNTQQQQIATKAIAKLSLIGGIPFVGGISGVILLIFLVFQLFRKQETAVLAINNSAGWETPWNWEIVWQVLIVGFFFIGQFILPLLLSISGFNVAAASLRVKAVYVLTTYILMALGGILVLYLSVKPFKPLPPDWFKLKFVSNWFVWGLGGYLVAIPLVLLVSLINQQIWQGQGGSNPLLLLALQAQDRVALAIFFLTASVAAPLFEEIMFRGFLLPSLTRYVPVWGAIVISAVIFAVAHLSLSEVLPLATLGIVLGIVYVRSRNLLASMLLHSLWNSGTLLSLFVLGSGM